MTRLRMVHFPGLRIQLERGWHEIPSHVRPAEVERLIDIVSSGVDAAPLGLFVDWSELDGLPDTLDAVAYVRVPEQVGPEAAERALARIDARVGLMQHATPGRWPSVAWDELEVKAALVSWWHREVVRPNHPLQNLEIKELPLDALAGATSEPVEFLELLEATVSIRSDSRLPWRQCAWQSIALRLERRLRGLGQRARNRLSRSGDAWPAVPGEDDELVRIGLAMEINGRVVSSPLARMLEREEVVSAMGQRTIEPSRPSPDSADSLNHGSKVVAFEQLGPLQPSDDWFVDIDAELPAESSVRLRILLHVREARRSGRFASVLLAHQSGSGGSTRIRAALSGLAAEGVVTILVDIAGASDWRQALRHLLIDWTRERSIVATSTQATDLVEAIRDHLVERGQQLCVVLDGGEYHGTRGGHGGPVHDSALRKWPCHWIHTTNVVDGISDLDGYAWVWMSSLPVGSNLGRRTVRKLLDKRVVVADVFEEGIVDVMAERSGGHLAHLFELARLAVLAAGDRKVGPRHVDEATTTLSQVLSARVVPRDWWRLERLNGMKGAPTGFMERGDEHLFLDSLLLAHGAEPQWLVHPLVHRVSPFRRTENLASPSILYVGMTSPSTPLDPRGQSTVIRRSLGDLGSLHVLSNVTAEDVRKIVVERGYEVLHLAGLGSEEGFLLVDEEGAPSLLPSTRIPLLWADSSLRCVILMFADSTAVIATAKTRPFVVALTGAIEDAAALAFARGFYERLAAGKPIQACFGEGRARLGLAGFDPAAFVLFEPKLNP